MPLITDFLRELDHKWTGTNPNKVRLPIIGSTALMLQADYERGTKDSDVLETADLDAATRTALEKLAGVGSQLHARHRMYIEIVARGLPLLPQTPVWHQVRDLDQLRNFHVEALDVVDVVISKLKRLHSNDIRDIEAMVDRGLVPHETLVERFMATVDHHLMDARAEDLPACIDHFHRIERDLLGVQESPIELPDWLTL